MYLHLRSIPIFLSLFPPRPHRSSVFPVVILIHLSGGGQFCSLIKFKQQQLLAVGLAMLEVAVHCPSLPTALGTWTVLRDAMHLWGRGRMNHHPIYNLKEPQPQPEYNQGYILGDMGCSGLWLSRNLSLMGLLSATWDSSSGNAVRA